MDKKMIGLIAIVVGATVASGIGASLYVEANTLTLQTTTSMNDSGLLDQIVGPLFGATGIHLRWVSAGTGQALNNTAKGNGDVVIVHSEPYELDFVNHSKTVTATKPYIGKGVMRMSFAYNYFILVGPSSNPAGIAASDNGTVAFSKIYTYGEANPSIRAFVSRGGTSGTRTKEKELWGKASTYLGGTPFTSANIDTKSWFVLGGDLGMGAALTMANEMDAYTLTDYGTWLNYRKTLTHLTNLTNSNPGGTDVLNVYSVIAVDPNQFTTPIKFELAKEFIYFMLKGGQDVMNNYIIDGERPFITNITKSCNCGQSYCDVCNGYLCTQFPGELWCSSIRSPTLIPGGINGRR